MAFPPVPVYPKAIDSDYTLYLVKDTAETKLRSDNPAWSSEIEIVPVDADEIELWAENGFVNIDGELIYYDSVDLDNNGKVNKLKGCARQLTGRTKHNQKCTMVRGYVVAEHHNQIVSAILKTEDFIGIDFDPRQRTLDWRIRNLQELGVLFDDHACPDINFIVTVLEDSQETGILIEYDITISDTGVVNTFRLDFGDGTFTTSELSGQHRYSSNAIIDPVVTVSNANCQIVQTPITRTNPAEPQNIPETLLDIPFPESPTIPDFTLVPIDVPEPNINLPPLAIPCPEATIGELISLITPIISNITIIGPSVVIPSTIVITPEIPSVIIIHPHIPPTIIIDPPIPPTIVIIPPPSGIMMNLNQTEPLKVDWGSGPQLSLRMDKVQSAKTYAIDPDLHSEFGTEFADLYEASRHMQVNPESVGIPSEIYVVPPEFDAIKIDSSDFPKEMKVTLQGMSIPEEIIIRAPEAFPKIEFNTDSLPKSIPMTYSGDAVPVKVDVSTTVKLQKPDEEIVLKMPEILLNKDGLPEIALKAPEGIPLTLSDELREFFRQMAPKPPQTPQTELVYGGPPIPVELKVTMQDLLPKDSEGNPCFMLVPCNK